MTNAGRFLVLVADDEPGFVNLLQWLLRDQAPECEVHWVKDGLEALDFLHRRNSHVLADRPHLILLDINMPRFNGFETLTEIKNDPVLSVIPVVALSSSATPVEIWNIYQANANGFISKPTNLDGCIALAKAIKTFWVDVCVSAPHEYSASMVTTEKGLPVALSTPEADSQPMRATEPDPGAGISTCQEHYRLMQDFAAAVKDLLDIHQQQFRAIVEADPECNRFDLLIHMANEKKQQAKYAYLRHVESHGCSNSNAIVNASGT